MKRHGNIDISGNLKLRGVVVDRTTTQGGFYSQQFGETAYKSDIVASTPNDPGFYGIFVRESDGNPPTFKNDTLIFDSESFYLHSNSAGKPTVSFRGSSATSVTDHGGLTGLGDNDHPQYLLVTDTPPGFYGLIVRESDGNPPAFKDDTLVFDSTYFYIFPTSIATGNKPTVSFRERQVDHGSLGGLSDDDHTQYIRVDGTRAFTGEQSHGGNRITNVGTPQVGTDAARLQDCKFYSKLSSLEDVKITNPQKHDFLQFYTIDIMPDETTRLRWINRPYLQFRTVTAETNTQQVDFPFDQQPGNVILFAVNEGLALGNPRLWVKSSTATATVVNPASPAWDLARDSTLSVSNNSGGSFTRGQILAIATSNPAATVAPRVVLADASSVTTMPAIAVAMDTIISGGTSGGTALIRGLMGGLDTSTITAGSLVYVSDTTPGAFTGTPPALRASVRQPIGMCVRSNSATGKILFFFGLQDETTISDGSNSHVNYDNLGVNNTQFYLSRNSSGRTVINLKSHTQEFNLSGEWQVPHNFNSKRIIFNTYDNRDIAITPTKADMSNPNTAFFYFNPTKRGRAVLLST